MRAQPDPAHVVMPGVHRSREPAQTLVARHAPGLGRTRAPRRLSQRVHVPLQPTWLAAAWTAVLPAAPASDPRRPDHVPKPDREPTARTAATVAADPLPRSPGERQALARPNLTQIDTPLQRKGVAAPYARDPSLAPHRSQARRIGQMRDQQPSSSFGARPSAIINRLALATFTRRFGAPVLPAPRNARSKSA